MAEVTEQQAFLISQKILSEMNSQEFKDLESAVQLPYIIKDKILMSPGYWKDYNYSNEVVKKGFNNTDWSKKEARALFLDHEDMSAAAWIGEVQNVHIDELGNVKGDIVIVDKNVAMKIHYGAKYGISPKIIGEAVDSDMVDFTFENMSVVMVPAVKTAYINNSENGEIIEVKTTIPQPEEKVTTMTEIEIENAVWDTAYVNDLPDSCFAYISPGGNKDKDGKTVPRSLRHLPYKDKGGKVDIPHLRNALARLPQTNIPPAAQASAKAKLVAAAKSAGVGDYKTQKGSENMGEDIKAPEVAPIEVPKVEPKPVELSKADEELAAELSRYKVFVEKFTALWNEFNGIKPKEELSAKESKEELSGMDDIKKMIEESGKKVEQLDMDVKSIKAKLDEPAPKAVKETQELAKQPEVTEKDSNKRMLNYLKSKI